MHRPAVLDWQYMRRVQTRFNRIIATRQSITQTRAPLHMDDADQILLLNTERSAKQVGTW